MATKNMIQPSLLSLDEILKGRLFEIPKFQRPYSWRTSQREDLFHDIDALLKDKKSDHFMATIVCLDMNKRETDGTDELSRMQIVDGQQRLTTLIILLKSIQLQLSSGTDKKTKAEADKLQKLLVRGKKLVLLQTNHQSAQIFRDFLVSGTIPDEKKQVTAAETDVAEAIKDSIEYTKQSNDLLELLRAIKNRLSFIFYTINDEKAVYTVFEVLNSRGLPVSALDKCKSTLMGIVYDKYKKAGDRKAVIDALHNKWESVYKAIGKRTINDSELLRFSATLCYYTNESIGKALSEDDALSFFREISSPSIPSENLPKQLRNRDEDVCVCISDIVTKVAEQLSEFEKDIKKSNAVTNITQARLLAVAIGLSDYSPEEKQSLMELWEKITFRIYGLHHKDSRNCVGDYVRLARAIYGGAAYSDVTERMNRIGDSYPIDEAIKELRGKPWYWDYKDELKYVLYRYEEHLASETGASVSPEVWQQIWSDTPAKTIEHIFPKTFSPELLKNWPNSNIDSQETLDSFVHNIGNLTLLPPGINSSLGQKAFTDKCEEYKRYSLRITDDVVKKTCWTKNDIMNREQSILDFISEKWK